MSHFSHVDRKTCSPLPLSIDECLPDDHPARFVVNVVEHMDLSVFTRRYAAGDIRENDLTQQQWTPREDIRLSKVTHDKVKVLSRWVCHSPPELGIDMTSTTKVGIE